jgi:HK97 family phage major capsid protein
MNAKLKELRGKIDERRKQLHEIFEQAGPDNDMSKVTCIEGDTQAKVERIRSLNDELTELAKEAQPLEEQEADLDRARKNVEHLGELRPHPGHPTAGRGRLSGKTLGDLFVESKAYKGYERGSEGPGPVAVLDLSPGEIKAALFETGAGWAPESLRTGVVVSEALRPIQILDLIPTAQTSQAAVVYMEETTATNAAAERAEGGAYAESTLVLTQRSKTVRSIGTSLPVTDEQLEDVEQARSYVDGRLGFFVRQRLDSQLLNGNDVAPNIQGFLNATGLQTQAKGADPVPDAVYKAMTKVRVTGRAFPSAAIFHPNDWQDVRLLKTADGIYIWGSPSEAGPERIWGLQVVQSDAIAENTGLVGDFTAAMCQLYIRRGLEVQIGFVNDDFTKGKQTVRAGLRAALVIYRGEAYCTVTGV